VDHDDGRRRLRVDAQHPGMERQHRQLDAERREQQNEDRPTHSVAQRERIVEIAGQIRKRILGRQIRRDCRVIARIDEVASLFRRVQRSARRRDQQDERDQHERRTEPVVNQERVRRLLPVQRSPDADQEEQRDQRQLEEQEEQDQVARQEDAEHPRLKQQEPDIERLPALLDMDRRQRGHHRDERRKHDQRQRQAVDRQMVLEHIRARADVDRLVVERDRDPVHPLPPGVGIRRVVAREQPERQAERDERRDDGHPALQAVVRSGKEEQHEQPDDRRERQQRQPGKRARHHQNLLPAIAATRMTRPITTYRP